jgi:guanylate kinase
VSSPHKTLTVLSGPAGVGKSSVVAALREIDPEVWYSVSATTRERRPGEVEGASYFFVTNDEFDAMVRGGELIEHATYAGNRYGTPRRPVEAKLAAGIPVLLEIEIEGARQVRSIDPDALLVFLAPPSWEELERRLRGRGTESAEVIARRLAQAKVELSAEGEFDEVIVNTSVREAAERLVALMREKTPGDGC